MVNYLADHIYSRRLSHKEFLEAFVLQRVLLLGTLNKKKKGKALIERTFSFHVGFVWILCTVVEVGLGCQTR